MCMCMHVYGLASLNTSAVALTSAWCPSESKLQAMPEWVSRWAGG